MQAVVGNYVLLRPLGEGGMGTVYLAQHHHLQYYAVVKSLHPNYAQNEALRQRFYTEAQLMSQIAHPAIVRLYDFVIQEGVPYLVMEYVQGTPLDELIAARGALSPEECYAIFLPIWDALGYLHAHKIIHRDIKPSNIMVLPEGGAKLIDFGIAKALDSDYKLTQTGMQVGTVLYMAPEQIQGLPVSPLTDLYAMGLVVYEGLFGRFPWDWQGKTQFQLYQMLLTEAPPIPDWAPPSWRAFFEKALAKNASDRYNSAIEMRLAFETLILNQGAAHAIIPHDGSSALPTPSTQSAYPANPSPTPAPPATPPPTPPSQPEVALPSPPPKKVPASSPIPFFSLIVVALIVVGGVVFFRYRAKKHRQQLIKQIYTLIESYNAANQAAFRKAIARQLQKELTRKYAHATLTEITIESTPSIQEPTKEDINRFDEGEFLNVYGDLTAYGKFSYQQTHYEEEDRRCSYERGFLFWSRREEGWQKWRYTVITPYECEAYVSIPCTWQIHKSGEVEGGIDVENLSYTVKDCQSGQPYRGEEWPLTECQSY